MILTEQSHYLSRQAFNRWDGNNFGRLFKKRFSRLLLFVNDSLTIAKKLKYSEPAVLFDYEKMGFYTNHLLN